MGCPDVEGLWRLAARQQYHLTEAFACTTSALAAAGALPSTPLLAMTAERLAFNLEVFAVTTHATLHRAARRAHAGLRDPPVDGAAVHAARYRELAPTRASSSTRRAAGGRR